MKKLALVLVAIVFMLTIALGACTPTETTPETFTVTFQLNYPNAPNGGTHKTVTVNEGEKVAKPADPTRTDYNFAGWVTTANGSTAFNFDSEIESDVTVYASWTAKQEQPTPPPEFSC